MPEEDMFEKEDGACSNRAYGWSEEDVVGKQDGSVRKVIECGLRCATRADW